MATYGLCKNTRCVTNGKQKLMTLNRPNPEFTINVCPSCITAALAVSVHILFDDFKHWKFRVIYYCNTLQGMLHWLCWWQWIYGGGREKGAKQFYLMYLFKRARFYFIAWARNSVHFVSNKVQMEFKPMMNRKQNQRWLSLKWAHLNLRKAEQVHHVQQWN